MNDFQMSEEGRKEAERNEWWETLDMNCPYLIKLWSSMYGTVEQRIAQLYIIRKNQNFNLKKQKSGIKTNKT
jgi:hypothetical protein